MRVLVTGASGFIGRHVIRRLQEREDVELIATARNLSHASELGFSKKVRCIEVDISESNTKELSRFGVPDALIHLAWGGLPNYKGQFHLEKNLPENMVFIQAMVNAGVKNITVTGTCFEYGMKEGCLKEEQEPCPTNPYGKAKDALRRYIETLEGDFSFKWLRLFYMYGEGQAANSLVSQLERAVASGEREFPMSGGEQIRDYLPITDVAQYIVCCALQNKIEGVINCCSGIPITVKQFVQDYIKAKNYQIQLNLGVYPYPDYEPMAFWGDNSKLKEVLGNGKC